MPQTPNTPLPEVAVIIIGCGPVGALMANLLGQRGIRTLILERDAEIYPLPRGVGMDDEVRRILDHAELESAFARNVIALKGMDLVNSNRARLQRFDVENEPRELGYPILTLFHQPTLEAELRNGFIRYPELVELRSGVEVHDLHNTGDGVVVEARHAHTGRSFTAFGQFVLGCDGGRSFVRKSMGVELEDFGLHQPWVVVDVIMKRPMKTDFYAENMCDPRRPGTFVPSPPPRNRWEFMVMPDDDPEKLLDESVLHEKIRPWAAPGDYTIERAVVYTFHALMARSWRRGRMLILGDAAHQMPPFLGQGMAAGFRDAFNLAWKLEAVLRGHAGLELLDTFHTERSEHVRKVIELAVRLGNIIQSPNRVLTLGLIASFWLSERLGIEMRTRAARTIPIGKGCFSRRFPIPAKHRCPFPQPWIRGGNRWERHLLDRFLGPHFTLLTSDDSEAPSLRPSSSGIIQPLRVVFAGREGSAASRNCIVDDEGVVEAWMRDRKAHSVLLRPDRVPFALYTHAHPSMNDIERDLLETLGGIPPSPAANGLSTATGTERSRSVEFEHANF